MEIENAALLSVAVAAITPVGPGSGRLQTKKRRIRCYT
jgi:hypothetical protein